MLKFNNIDEIESKTNRKKVKCKIKHKPEYGIGKTDKIITYCCSSTPCYFVEFKNYSGYFAKKDIILV